MEALLEQAPLVCLVVGIIATVALVLQGFQQDAAEKKMLSDTLKEASSIASRSGGLNVMITGANSGIGFHLTKRLAENGVHVIMGCRSAKRGKDALAAIKAEIPTASLQLCVVDVSNPVSVREAAASLRRSLVKLDILYCNAGNMPVTHMDWGVALHATALAALPYFFETGRAHGAGSHFLQQPQSGHNYTAAGAPSVLATHVLGHALLIGELRPLLAPGAVHGNDGGGRVVWSGSRAASAAFLDWTAVSPPPATHEGEVNVTGGHSESYGEAKFATDLYSAALLEEGVSSIVVCPGAVMTHMTPTILQWLKPVLTWFRPLLPGFNMTSDRGILAHLGAGVGPLPALARPGVKHVMWWGGLVPATNGAPPVLPDAAQRMGDVVKVWLDTPQWRKA